MNLTETGTRATNIKRPSPRSGSRAHSLLNRAVTRLGHLSVRGGAASRLLAMKGALRVSAASMKIGVGSIAPHSRHSKDVRLPLSNRIREVAA